METAGIQTIFNRSIEKQLRYTEFYGDGDSKGRASIENIYPGIKVTKLECIGHVQKRVGSRLRKLRQKVGGLGGTGRLNDAIIDRLQNYYGMAIRSNVGDLSKMKKAVAAVLCHVSAPADKPFYHENCPEGGDSWCRYQADKVNSTSTYIPGPGLPEDVFKHIKLIFEELSNDNLLSKCLHGKTQNQNESYNATVWDRIPKTTFVELKTFEIGVYDAVAHFNIGNTATILIYKAMNINPGYYTIVGCDEANSSRKQNALRKSSDIYKNRRRIIRGLKKTKTVKKNQKEGKLYGAGDF